MTPRCSACPVAEGTLCRSAVHSRYCELAARDRADLAANPNHDAYWLRFLSGAPEPDPPAPSLHIPVPVSPGGCCGGGVTASFE
jgi:hypothetical protein